MSTIIFVSDTPNESGSLLNPNGNSPITFACWDGAGPSAQEVLNFLNLQSGTNNWPTPTIDITTGTLNFASFTANDGTTVPAYSFPLGSIIGTNVGSNGPQGTQPFARNYLELHGTIRNEY